MKYLKTNLKTVLVLILMLGGLVVTVYLVKNPQIFKSRADVNKLKVTGRDGVEASYENGKFVTPSDHITIGIQQDAVKNGLFKR